MENKGKAENFTVWDDRYNVDKGANYGINNYYENGLSSRLRDKLDSIYKSNIYHHCVMCCFLRWFCDRSSRNTPCYGVGGLCEHSFVQVGFFQVLIVLD